MCKKEELSTIKKIISKEMEILREDLLLCMKEIKSSGQKFSNWSDEASRVAEINSISVREKRLDDRFIALKRAVERIDSGWDGLCLSCGADIPLKRLMVCPETNLCVRCKLLQDKMMMI